MTVAAAAASFSSVEASPTASSDALALDSAAALLAGLTKSERARMDAYLRLGTFAAAAAELDCDPDTVSATWHAIRKRLAMALANYGTAPNRPA